MAVNEVQLREEQIRRLISLYRASYRKIISEIGNATTFGRINRVALLQRITGILTDLGDDVNRWAAEEIPLYYQDGLKDALKDLRKFKVDLRSIENFNVIHQDAIAALVDEVQTGFSESLRGIGRNARVLINEAIRMEINTIIAQGFITDADRRLIKAAVKERLRQQGLSALIDKAGRRWTFDRYTEMLVRTKAVEARNTGVGNRLAEFGFDLVQVSDHNSDHDECAVWEGKILSYSGRTPGYPTYNQALDAGLFHPNCKHAINVINLELASKTKAYTNPLDTSP